MRISWVFRAYFVRIQWVFHVYFMRIPCVFYAFSMRIPCVFRVCSMLFLCVFHAYFECIVRIDCVFFLFYACFTCILSVLIRIPSVFCAFCMLLTVLRGLDPHLHPRLESSIQCLSGISYVYLLRNSCVSRAGIDSERG
jgi:hypothetical protein